jgi:hypothetical protein
VLSGVEEHALLTGKAKALFESSPDAFHAQQQIAELLLELPVPVKESMVTQLTLAVVMQVNFQIEQGIDPLYISASSSAHTRNSVNYRNRYIDPRALQIARAALRDGAYSGMIRSFRYQGRP